MVDVSTLQARLTEAETALHKLLTGAATVDVSQGDKRVTFTAAKVSDLRAYIFDLKRQLGLPSRRAIGVRFH